MVKPSLTYPRSIGNGVEIRKPTLTKRVKTREVLNICLFEALDPSLIFKLLMQ